MCSAMRLSLSLDIRHVSPVREVIQVKYDPSPGVDGQKYTEDANYVHHESCFHLGRNRVKVSTPRVGRAVSTKETGHWGPVLSEKGAQSGLLGLPSLGPCSTLTPPPGRARSGQQVPSPPRPPLGNGRDRWVL